MGLSVAAAGLRRLTAGWADTLRSRLVLAVCPMEVDSRSTGQIRDLSLRNGTVMRASP